MNGFSISKPSIVNISGPNWISFPEITINYNDSGFVTSNGLISNYSLASQVSPIFTTFNNLVVKYGCEPGNCYSGNTLNDFDVVLYKNNTPTVLRLNIQNPSSSDGPVVQSSEKKISLSPRDTWALHLSPGSHPPTTGKNVWCISISYN